MDCILKCINWKFLGSTSLKIDDFIFYIYPIFYVCYLVVFPTSYSFDSVLRPTTKTLDSDLGLVVPDLGEPSFKWNYNDLQKLERQN